ncbi:S9 family peptidase [Fimbriimonas ginsengisoli]|uniref:Dipeptidyl peptidase IV n=1 Tax=Fimbriimonas ginsengisoli Gsoil 348 TaxID=661478 RepID=A0A068NRI0_FIMGI|nr:prolyl oligopeptidase family serine peptidase [Fimbriimonas ginsengisoli]AIE84209.1 Dipeptidyl peptidase IV [Fimbriimonas ginsengisoli Gsoil 348]
MQNLLPRRLTPVFLGVLSLSVALAGSGKPPASEIRESYRRANGLRQLYNSNAYKLSIDPHWYADGTRFWYRNDLREGKKEFIGVLAESGQRGPAFDHERLAAALGKTLNKPVDPAKLPFSEIAFEGDLLRFDADGKGWKCKLSDYTLEETTPKPRARPPRSEPWNQDLHPASLREYESKDGKWVAQIEGFNVMVWPKGGAKSQITKSGAADGYFARLWWTPDDKRIVAVRVHPGDRRLVDLIESSPAQGGRAVHTARVYDLPGDKVDTFDIWILDPEKNEAKQISADPVDYGDLPSPDWERDGRHFTYEKMDRGYGRWRLIEVDSVTGESKALLDDHPSTFVDSTSQFIWYAKKSDEIVWRSERDGWGHLYLLDDKRELHRITSGPWVVRTVEKVDEVARTILFTASGREAGEDPYFIRWYRVNFDGTGLVDLTPEHGNHVARLSPKADYLIDSVSTVDSPPVHELRRTSDGKLLATLEQGDIRDLKAKGFRAPEPFVAKGRDGKTDIYGIVYRPSNFNPRKRYPVIENIYAGPQDSFVPKSFASWRSMASLAELGFIVVQIDGMGTRNRGKAFHDVCYKNLADAGFPDRILWMTALAAKYPSVDISRVGVYGTSAGGQNSTGAVLFHPEFYKVAVSSCGCHDNRMDKIWWNEQWMGLMGPHYAEQSNITNAGKLKGKLLLFVGEQDHNVPPESTYRLVDALIKANKDFDFLVLPGSDHTDGGAYGERKRRDFFVRNLLGLEPPKWNEEEKP